MWQVQNILKRIKIWIRVKRNGRIEANNNVRIYTSIYIDFAYSYSSKGKESFLWIWCTSVFSKWHSAEIMGSGAKNVWVSEEKSSYEIK